MTESIQKKLLRVRPPRVRITYDVESGGAIEKRELPFIVGIFADLSGERDDAAEPATLGSFKSRKMLDIDRDNFDAELHLCQPRVSLANVPDVFAGNGKKLKTPLSFSSLADFEPAQLIKNIAALNGAFEQRNALFAAQADAEADATHALLNRQLSLILHDTAFQKLEATWRGLHYLVSRTETGSMLKLRVFNATQQELHDDLRKAVEFDQSHLFKLIYEAAYGTYGGLPYSLLLGAYEIGRSADDVDFLRRMAQIAASAHAPFITAASSQLFGLNDYADLAKPRELSKIFESADMAGWQEFRESEDARYVALVLPRVLMRTPYFENEEELCESADGKQNAAQSPADAGTPGLPDKRKFLWGNAALMLAERITNAFALRSWPAAICGVEGGGLVEGLPHYVFRASGDGTTEQLCPTEITISDRRNEELSALGFIALCHCRGTDNAAFFGSQTVAQPKKYIDESKTTDAIISARLPAILVTCRFAHYVKVIMRDKVGSFLTRANVEAYLNAWIADYVLLDDNASAEVEASYPLRAANIVVTDVPGSPGAYQARLFIKPHFLVEVLSNSGVIVVDMSG